MRFCTSVVRVYGWMISTGLVWAGTACSLEREQDVAQPAPAVAVAPRQAGEITARCTVAPECPGITSCGQLTTGRSAHTWTIENATGRPCKYVVALEIFDDLGHSKIKEVPGEVAANSRLDDSTSISIMTTYDTAQPVELQARTTIRVQERQIAESTQACRFDVN